MLYKFTFTSGYERCYRIKNEQFVALRLTIASSHRFFHFEDAFGYDMFINLNNVETIEALEHEGD